MQTLQWIVIGAMLGICSCSSAPPPRTVVVERKVYVYVPEPSGPRMPPGPPIAESPLLVEAEQERAEDTAERIAAQPAPAVVYVPTPVYEPAYVSPRFYDPGPSVVVVRERHRHHARPSRSRGWYERAAVRCERRGSRWAREKCLGNVGRR